MMNGKERSCESCKHVNKEMHEEPCKCCTHNATDNYEPMTNADRIRNMTDEELERIIVCPCSIDMKMRCTETDCKKCGIAWLQREVEEGEQHGRNEF